MQGFRRWAIAAVLALSAGAGAAAAAELVQGDAALLAASAPPGLLGPITEVGRTGWDCAPEHAATARSANAAQLPRD